MANDGPVPWGGVAGFPNEPLNGFLGAEGKIFPLFFWLGGDSAAWAIFCVFFLADRQQLIGGQPARCWVVSSWTVRSEPFFSDIQPELGLIIEPPLFSHGNGQLQNSMLSNGFFRMTNRSE